MTAYLNNEGFGKNVFQRTKDDENPGTTADERKFLQIMNESEKSETVKEQKKRVP
jgi:hypothetical protein